MFLDGRASGGRTASACKGPEPTWEPVEGDRPAGHRRAAPGRRRSTAPVERRPTTRRPPSEARARRRRARRATAGSRSTASAAAFGQAGSAAGELLEESGAFAAGEFQVLNVFDKGGERYPKFTDDASTSSPSCTSRTTSWSRSRRSSPQRTEPGRAPARAGDRRDPPHQYVYMIRDLGASRQPARVHHDRLADRVPASVLAAAPPRRASCVANRSRRRRTAGEGARPMGQYLPVVACCVLAVAVRSAQLRRVAAARAAPPVGGQGSAVRVRHRAEPRATRSASRSPSTSSRCCSSCSTSRSSSSTRTRSIARSLGAFGFWEMIAFSVVFFAAVRLRGRARGALDWGPLQRCRGRLDASMVPPSARRPRTIRRVGAEGRIEERQRGRRSPDGRRQRRPRRRARRARRTTSSPASSRTSSSGRAAAAAVAGVVRSRVLRDRDDGHRCRALRPQPASAWRSSAPRRARPTS